MGIADFFVKNIGTVAVSLILIAILLLVVMKIIRNKRKGISSCSCGCSNCPYSAGCHSKEKGT